MASESLKLSAEGVDDQIGWTMAFIRAAERVQVHRMAQCAAAYPHLHSLINADDPNARSSPRMALVREHAYDLAKSSIASALKDLHHSAEPPSSHLYQQTRSQIMVRLKRLTPGATTSISAIQRSNGTVTSEPAAMAAALQQHWERVFGNHDIDAELLENWLESLPPPGEHYAGWELPAQLAVESVVTV